MARLIKFAVVVIGFSMLGRPARADFGIEPLAAFVTINTEANPGLALGANGAFYGTTPDGGSAGQGILFGIASDGSGVATIANFPVNDEIGTPVGPVIFGNDGQLYGVSSFDVFYRISPATGAVKKVVDFFNGAPSVPLAKAASGNFYYPLPDLGLGETINIVSPAGSDGPLATLPANGSIGRDVVGGLAVDSVGAIYGAASGGGAKGQGTIFKLFGAFSVVASFGNTGSLVGSFPASNVVVDSAGNLYGLTGSGGTKDSGTIYKCTPAGVLSVIQNLDEAVTGVASGNTTLIVGGDGKFYAQLDGGPGGNGTVVRFDSGGNFTVLRAFGPGDIASTPTAIAVNSSSLLVGTAPAPTDLPQGGSVFRVKANGDFAKTGSLGYASNGGNPRGSLTMGLDGNFYGTTSEGGSAKAGTFFRMAPNGGLATVASFSKATGTSPTGKLILAANGSFYGVAENDGPGGGSGTIYNVTTAGVITVVAAFTDRHVGAVPVGITANATKDVFYGVTQQGGDNEIGTIFKVTPAGSLTRLYSFGGSPLDPLDDGGNPSTPLLLGTDGFLYGATSTGGFYDHGTVFRASTDGSVSVLADFDYATNDNFDNISTSGYLPRGPLVRDAAGNIYGTAAAGGPTDGGTIFRVSPAGGIARLAAFDQFSDRSIGYNPEGGLILGSDGSLYGQLSTGVFDSGAVFKATLSGKVTKVASFDFPQGSGAVDCALLQAPDGMFYGMRNSDGPGGAGTVFRVAFFPDPPKVIGKTTLISKVAKVTLKGTLPTPRSLLEYQVGKGKFVRLKKAAKTWKISLTLKKGRNIITLRAVDPKTKRISSTVRVTVTVK